MSASSGALESPAVCPTTPRRPALRQTLDADTYTATLRQSMHDIELEFQAQGVTDIFGKLEAPRNNDGTQADRWQQLTDLGLDFDEVKHQFCRKECAKLQQVPHIARRKAAGEFLRLVPGDFAVADSKREGYWRAMSHQQKSRYLEGWLHDMAQDQLDAAITEARSRWIRMWAIKLDTADAMRKEYDSRTATAEDLDVYLHLATSARKYRKKQHDEEQKPKRFRRELIEELVD
jgi:hypothetical protein